MEHEQRLTVMPKAMERHRKPKTGQMKYFFINNN